MMGTHTALCAGTLGHYDTATAIKHTNNNAGAVTEDPPRPPSSGPHKWGPQGSRPAPEAAAASSHTGTPAGRERGRGGGG